MNKTFDIKRFCNVVRRDGMSYFQNFGFTLALFLSIPVGIWFVLYINMSELSFTMSDNRYGFLKFIMIMVMILAPSRLYKTSNDPRRGIHFAMLPASSLEKFLSMLLYCFVVTPILYMAGALAIDCILVLIPGSANPYDGFISNYTLNTERIVDLGTSYNEYAHMIRLPLAGLFGHLAYTSIFMFTNMVFKKRKVSNTLGILTILGIILIVMVIRFTINYEESIGSFNEDEFLEYNKHLLRWVYYASYISSVIISIVMLYLTYYKIKKQTY